MTKFSRIPHRRLLSLIGPDAISLLERTVTNTVTDWPVGEQRYGALLTPQGKVIADFIAHATDPNSFLLDVHEDALNDLVKRLKMFRVRAFVEIEPELNFAVVHDPDTPPDPRSPLLPGRKIVLDEDAGEPMKDWDEKCIASGVPEWGRDYRAAEVFPTDINMDVFNGIDYKKGCFVGQEVASRMKRKGSIRKRTLVVEGDCIAKGTDITARSIIGTVTSVEGNKGLAVMRLDRLAKSEVEGQALMCGDAEVSLNMDASPWVEEEIEMHRVQTR